jgi:hypothetical protein
MRNLRESRRERNYISPQLLYCYPDIGNTVSLFTESAPPHQSRTCRELPLLSQDRRTEQAHLNPP